MRAAVVIAALLSAVLAGCGAAPRPTARLDGLLVLAGDTQGSDLRGWRDGTTNGSGDLIDTPDGTAWVAAGRADVLAAALASGTLRISDPLRADRDPAWHKPNVVDFRGDAAKGPFYFPSWDPEGGRLAVLAGDLDAAPRLTLIDPSIGTSMDIELGGAVVAAPPVWVSDDLVAVLAGSTDAPTSILLDTTTDEVREGPRGARLLGSSADGRLVAVVADDGQPVTIRTTEGWLADDGSSVGSIDTPSGSITASALALDADGGRLAIAWLTDDGTIRLAVHDRAAGWRRVAEPSIGGAAAAVVAWLR